MKQELVRLISENQVIMLDTSIAMDDQFKKPCGRDRKCR